MDTKVGSISMFGGEGGFGHGLHPNQHDAINQLKKPWGKEGEGCRGKYRPEGVGEAL